ncbi:MAG: ArnT family glycosyltransferase, partial [Planctomycetota bacterium]
MPSETRARIGLSPPASTIALLALPLGLAVLLQVLIVARSPVIENDGIVFISAAKWLRRAPLAAVRQSEQHPGYPAMILASHAAVSRLIHLGNVDSWILAARLAAGLCGVLSVGLVWLLGRHFFSATVATTAAVLCAAMPAFRQNAADAMSDSPHLLFFLLATWAAAKGLGCWHARWFLLAGLASGLAYWIRPEGLLVAVVCGAVAAVCFALGRAPDRRAGLACLAALVLCAFVTSAPYVVAKGRLTEKKDLAHLLRRGSWQTGRIRTAERQKPFAPTAPQPSRPVREEPPPKPAERPRAPKPTVTPPPPAPRKTAPLTILGA